jgi:hypothetical protein
MVTHHRNFSSAKIPSCSTLREFLRYRGSDNFTLMLAPLRRSLSERAVGVTLQCRLCTRQIHAQSSVRSAAAATQQQIQEFKTFPSESKNKEISFPTSHAQNSSKGSIKSTDGSKTEQIKNTSANSSVAEDPLQSSSDFNSTYGWEISDIFDRYPRPEPEQIPSKIHTQINRKPVKVTWRKEPLEYLRHGLKLKVQTDIRNVILSHRRLLRVRVSASWGTEKYVAIGDGHQKVHSELPLLTIQESATEAAALHLILKAANSTMFRYALMANLATVKAEEAIREKSSKVDVYDYAAQLNTLPVFDTIKFPGSSMPQAKDAYFCRVSVPGTNIVGEAFHSSNRAYAEIGACMNFKKRAEELHQGEKMLVKHINTLTSQTGQKFLQYCKMKHKNWEQFQFTSKSINGLEVLGQLHWGSRLLSECTMFR